MSLDPTAPIPPNLKRRRRFQLRRRRYMPESLGALAQDDLPPREDEGEIIPVREERSPCAEELEKLKDRLIRLQADHENYRKRVAREREEQTKFALEGLVRELLVSLDNFDRAMAHRVHSPEVDAFAQGLELTHQHLWETLRKHGVERIPALGQPFDPHLHEALATENVSGVEDGTVLDVLQEGYTLGGRVLRPALVRVAKADTGTASGGAVGD
jgi:molecular chaperone GrpE